MRPAILEPMQLILARHEYTMLVARLLRIDVGVQYGRLIVVAHGQEFADAVENATHANEVEATLRADAIDGGVRAAYWNGWPDERGGLEKLRDRLPLIARKPPAALPLIFK